MRALTVMTRIDGPGVVISAHPIFGAYRETFPTWSFDACVRTLERLLSQLPDVAAWSAAFGTSEALRRTMLIFNDMDAPGHPRCRCGLDSVCESGYCQECHEAIKEAASQDV